MAPICPTQPLTSTMAQCQKFNSPLNIRFSQAGTAPHKNILPKVVRYFRIGKSPFIKVQAAILHVLRTCSSPTFSRVLLRKMLVVFEGRMLLKNSTHIPGFLHFPQFDPCFSSSQARPRFSPTAYSFGRSASFPSLLEAKKETSQSQWTKIWLWVKTPSVILNPRKSKKAKASDNAKEMRIHFSDFSPLFWSRMNSKVLNPSVSWLEIKVTNLQR